MTARRPLSLVFPVLFLAACSSSDSPTSPPPQPPGGRVIKDSPGFAADIQEIFNRRGCTASQCHGFSPGSGGLDLQIGTARGSLVNVASPTTGETRVIPGDAQNSYLVKKLEGRASVGARMPFGGTPLDNTDLTNIRNWIDRGAASN